MSTLLSDTALNRTLSRLDRQTAPHGGLPVPYHRRRARTAGTRTVAAVLYGSAVVLLLFTMVIMPIIAEQTLFANPT